jgi:hypothetical protein
LSDDGPLPDVHQPVGRQQHQHRGHCRGIAAEFLGRGLFVLALVDSVDHLERGGSHLVVQLEVFVLGAKVLGVVALCRFFLVLRLEPRGQGSRQPRAETFDEFAVGGDQMAELPGDVVGLGHRPHEQVRIRETVEIAADKAFRQGVRGLDGIAGVHG